MFELFKNNKKGQMGGGINLAVGVVIFVIAVGVIAYSILTDISATNQADGNLSSTDKLIWRYLPTILLLVIMAYFGYLLYSKK